ncbi:hypothetical protein V7S43_011146 [Phytophthora oleae]|uniref:Secreted protein n=1 Tax=Phytophthora oleae TaxID=2107226 RepID=A0ABD3FDE5_9STRA
MHISMLSLAKLVRCADSISPLTLKSLSIWQDKVGIEKRTRTAFGIIRYCPECSSRFQNSSTLSLEAILAQRSTSIGSSSQRSSSSSARLSTRAVMTGLVRGANRASNRFNGAEAVVG